jgi:hypothetical protein
VFLLQTNMWLYQALEAEEQALQQVRCKPELVCKSGCFDHALTMHVLVWLQFVRAVPEAEEQARHVCAAAPTNATLTSLLARPHQQPRTLQGT